MRSVNTSSRALLVGPFQRKSERRGRPYRLMGAVTLGRFRGDAPRWVKRYSHSQTVYENMAKGFVPFPRIRRTSPAHSESTHSAQSEERSARSLFLALVMLAVMVLPMFVALPRSAPADTNHKVYFKGTDSELDVYFIHGRLPGPTLLLLGGIQGDEPGGYLAADLYADITLRKGNLIVVPRANFLSIVANRRGVQGDMNRKFAGSSKGRDRDLAIVGIIKGLMKQSDFFLNLHDGSGFYFPKWESPMCNPMRFGQSIIIDAEDFTRVDGTVFEMGDMVRRVLAKVNAQISDPEHLFRLNNHRTLQRDTKHKEQRLSATFHALTRVGIPAFGIETSKNIADYRLRVRYQTMVVNSFLEEFGIVPDNPRMYLENPHLKYLIVSINGRTPIVVTGRDVIKVYKGDSLRLVHIESNYSRGLTARIKGVGKRLNDLNIEVRLTRNAVIQVRKDRFLIAEVPVEVLTGRTHSLAGIHFEPCVRYFCVRLNNRSFLLEPGDQLKVVKGDTLVILDPNTNLDAEAEKAVRLDLRGFQATSSPYPMEDRGHQINTATDLQKEYGQVRGDVTVYALQAKLKNKVFGESFIAVAEPRLEYLVMRESQWGTFVVYPGDRLELPPNAVVKIMDIKTNIPESIPLFLTMSGNTVRWQQSGSAGIDASKLVPKETIPLDITRDGRSLGRVWLKKGKDLRLTSGRNQPRVPLSPVRY